MEQDSRSERVRSSCKTWAIEVGCESKLKLEWFLHPVDDESYVADTTTNLVQHAVTMDVSKSTRELNTVAQQTPLDLCSSCQKQQDAPGTQQSEASREMININSCGATLSCDSTTTH